MAHFAKINSNNVVETVIVINNEDLLDENNVESETVGINYCKSLYGEDTNWVQTSYNNNFRYHYASIGGIWDAQANAFYEPQPYSSWTLDSNYEWQPPIAKPEENDSNGIPYGYEWDEDNQSWIRLDNYEV